MSYALCDLRKAASLLFPPEQLVSAVVFGASVLLFDANPALEHSKDKECRDEAHGSIVAQRREWGSRLKCQE
jgi:hypothetical protein